MTTILNAYKNALLADATYALTISGWNNKTGTAIEEALKDRMTPTLAQYIGENFTVVTHIEMPDVGTSGFDATVWRENTSGKIYVSMQGTKGAADFLTDAKLTLGGNAGQQIIDMANWWLQITTPEGQMARQIGTEVDPVSGFVSAKSDVPGTGLVSAADLVQGVEVNGHSLGGYLATAFTRLFGSEAHVSHTSTFNSAGFAPGSESAFANLQNLIGQSYGLGRLPNSSEQSNYFAVNGLNITTNSFYFNQQGQRVDLYQEGGVGVANHYMYKLTDLLAVGAALEKLDSTFTMDKLNALSKVGSNDPKGSLEGVLDGLRRALHVPNVERLPSSDAADSDPSRVTFQATLATLQNSQIYKDLANQVLIRPTGSDLRASARNNFGAIVALQDLSPIYLTGKDTVAQAALDAAWQNSRSDDYTAWVTDKSSSTPTTFTNQWITDRATMLGVLVERNKLDQTGALSPNPSTGLLAGHYLDVSNSVDITVGLDTVTTQQYLFGGNVTDVLTGRNATDHLYGGAGDDTLDGQGGSDYLEGGAGADNYNFTGSFGKDTVFDADGLGAIQIDGTAIGTAKGIGERGAWAFDLGAGVYAGLAVYDDARSSTGKRLVITKGADTANTITLDNFDLAAALSSQGYLGIKLDNIAKLAIKEGGGSNVWGDLNFDPATLTGTSAIIEGTGQSFTLYLNQDAKAGESITLALSDLADKFKAILGDSIVDANGAVITLAEGQTQVSFALVQEGDVTADASAYLSASYTGADGSATSNAWGVNLQDAGPISHTYNGDQRAKLIGIETQLTVTADQPSYNTYAWSETAWAADGTLTNGVAEVDFSDVITGTAGNDKIAGLGGNDALDGGAGNDEIDGGVGDDLIGGGAGSDNIKGGAGNDVILSATNLVAPQRLRDNGWSPTLVNSGGSTAMDDAPDVVDAGDGDDIVYAGRGDDRVDGGSGADILWGLAGNDIIEGGAGDDQLLGDGSNFAGYYESALGEMHGNDFLDGGDGNDILRGAGKNDVLFGGLGDDQLVGDASESELAGQYHGNDYLDGEDGNDMLWGGGGEDTLYGGAGNDTYVFQSSDGHLYVDAGSGRLLIGGNSGNRGNATNDSDWRAAA